MVAINTGVSGMLTLEEKKKRKAEKAKEAEEQRAKDQLANTLKKAMNPNDGADYWDACFNITY